MDINFCNGYYFTRMQVYQEFLELCALIILIDIAKVLPIEVVPIYMPPSNVCMTVPAFYSLDNLPNLLFPTTPQ